MQSDNVTRTEFTGTLPHAALNRRKVEHRYRYVFTWLMPAMLSRRLPIGAIEPTRSHLKILTNLLKYEHVRGRLMVHTHALHSEISDTH